MNEAFTQGEWTVAGSGLSVNAGPFGKIRQERAVPVDELKANARLIAQGPALYRLAVQYASECAECNGTGYAQGEATGLSVVCSECHFIRDVLNKVQR